MIGRVIFLLDGNQVAATLGDDGRWSCPEWPELGGILDVRFDPRDHSPADGVRGHRQVAEAARLLHGEPRFPPRLPGPAATDH